MDLIAVGDVFVNRDDIDRPFDHVRPLLKSARIVFGNQEGVYSDTSVRAPSSGIQVVVRASTAAALANAGFTVMSCSNNHIVDAGYEGLADTLAALEHYGIVTVGAGPNIAQARTPRVITQDGVRVAFLAYAAVFPAGYDAKERRPGIAPIRADTFYAPPDTKQMEAPARAPRIITIPFQPDVDALRKDIAEAARQADVIVTSFHWGVFPDPFVVTDYERQYARIAIDAGATVVLGHHHHLLRGVELYRGRPIFYGLGQFVFDLPRFNEMVTETQLKEMRKRSGDYALFERTEQPLMPMHRDALLTMLVYLRFGRGPLTYAGVLPCRIGASDGVVMPLQVDSPEGREVLDYVVRAGDEQGFARTLDCDSGESIAGYRLATVRVESPS